MGSAIAIIPARGGSKRIPRKNIKPFLGKPVIQYAIEAALRAKLFDEVCVSTDDAEIAEVARRYGANVPFFRSADNSSDYATTVDVLLEVLQNYKLLEGRTFESVCCIYACAPFVTPELIRRSFDMLTAWRNDSCLSVLKYSHPIQRAIELDEGNRVRYVWPENWQTRTQDLPARYHDAGQLYWVRSSALFEKKALVSEKTCGIVLNPHEAIDIDTEEDWRLAEMKMRLKNESRESS